jgi:GT2 family glycosyltransferase
LLFLDSDDPLTPGAITSHLATLARNPDAALSFGAVTTIDEHGREIYPAHVCRPRKDYFLMLLEGNPIATPGATLIRRSAFLEAGMFDEAFRMAEDYRLYLRLARLYPLALTPDCVLNRRIHGNNVSTNMEPMLAATMAALDLVESENSLTNQERRILAHGRRRWAHECRPETTIAYRLRTFYFRLRAMLSVSPIGYFPNRTSMHKECP